MQDQILFQSGRIEVNGMPMYYEMYGEGGPLVLVHGGGSTIQSSFENIIPLLAKGRKVLAVELQAHGRTGDRPGDFSFAQDADDVATLLQKLGIAKADFLGFSNGGHVAIEIALRHAALVNNLILASAFYRREAVPEAFWAGFENATIDQVPAALCQAYLAANNSEAGLMNMFRKDVKRMKDFKGWDRETIKAIAVPVLVIAGTHDVLSVEHAVEMFRLFPKGELAIFPGGHGTYLGSVESLENGRWPGFNAAALIDEFLAANR